MRACTVPTKTCLRKNKQQVGRLASLEQLAKAGNKDKMPHTKLKVYQMQSGYPMGEHEGSPCKRPSARFELETLPQRCHKGKPCRLRPCKARARDSLPDLFGLFGSFEQLTGTRKCLLRTHLSPRKVLRRSLGTFSSRPPHKAPVGVLPGSQREKNETFQTGDGKQRRTTKAATTRLRTCSNDSGSKCHHAARISAWRLGLLVTRTCHRLPIYMYIR